MDDEEKKSAPTRGSFIKLASLWSPSFLSFFISLISLILLTLPRLSTLYPSSLSLLRPRLASNLTFLLTLDFNLKSFDQRWASLHSSAPRPTLLLQLPSLVRSNTRRVPSNTENTLLKKKRSKKKTKMVTSVWQSTTSLNK